MLSVLSTFRKIELPSGGSGSDLDVRFSGAFVLYNYARISSLFTHYNQACEKGKYMSCLPLS